ncbi:MAG: phosphate ABC transporter permease PstA [Treponema sp.]|nr:phosphate ABC transporter permease PstA [Treponema sp.]
MECGSTEPRKARRQLAGATSRSLNVKSFWIRAAVYFSTGITLFCILFMLSYILIKGIPYLRGGLFSWTYTSDNCSVVPALVNTLTMTLLALLIAGPLGIGSAIYLVEYARKGNPFVKLVRMTAETLTGIPSIIYGLFGMLLFVGYLKWGYSMLAGAATLAIMILPTIMRTTEEALLAVPSSFREGSFGLGAGKLRTIFKIVLPSAVPGILSGIILATGRVVGETAALIYTAGTVAQIPENLFGSGRTLAIHMYVLSSEGLHTGQAFATAVVLLVMVSGINALAGFLARKIGK